MIALTTTWIRRRHKICQLNIEDMVGDYIDDITSSDATQIFGPESVAVSANIVSKSVAVGEITNIDPESVAVSCRMTVGHSDYRLD